MTTSAPATAQRDWRDVTPYAVSRDRQVIGFFEFRDDAEEYCDRHGPGLSVADIRPQKPLDRAVLAALTVAGEGGRAVCVNRLAGLVGHPAGGPVRHMVAVLEALDRLMSAGSVVAQTTAPLTVKLTVAGWKAAA